MLDTPRPSDEATLADAAPDDAPVQLARLGRPLGRGDTLGRYVVLERLGVGGMGEVFAAYDPELDRKIAVKLLRPGNRTRDPRAPGPSSSPGADRLLREAQAMAKLSHRNVIAVHDVGTHAGRVFVAMEFVDGGTLAEWMAGGPHAWPAVLERFLAAGQGLAAAHAEGLVHRDFKPANVLLGKDGRVRVADFGLARRTPGLRVADDADAESKREPTQTESRTDTLALQITGSDAMLGTPAYMAPEQYARARIDARADQFSFCVALYEALYGERPFAGDSLHALMLAVSEGRIREPPPGSAVPGWLRRAVVRGLACAPEQRWPDMDALLVQLRRDPAALRRRALVLAGFVATILALVGVALGQRDTGLPSAIQLSPPVCVGAEQALGDAYDADDRATIERRFTELGADASAAELVPRLDAWARQWRETWTDACQATRVRGDQSEDLLDRRMACLDLERGRFGAFVDMMAEADANVAARALELLGELGDLSGCSDRSALMKQVPLPRERERVAAIIEAEAMLEQVRLLQLAGRPQAAASLLVQQRELVERADWGPLRGVFLSARAWQLLDEDRRDEAERLLQQAFATALEIGDNNLARALARRIALLHANAPERAQQSLLWLELASALAIREGSDEAVLAQLALVRSQALASLGELDQAEAAANQALERLRRVEPEGMAVGSALYQLAAVELRRGRHERAGAHVEQALAIWLPGLGPEHTNTLAGISMRASLARERGDLDQARAGFEQVLAVKRRNLGPDSSETLVAELDLAGVLAELGQLEPALALARHAVDLRRRKLGSEPTLIGQALVELAAIERRAGLLDQAYEHVLEGDRLLLSAGAGAGAGGSDQLARISALSIRGELERERGQIDDSRRSLRAAEQLRASWAARNGM